jgi:3-hydroxyacyl-[acyl-carrier-protein] dehydratase
MAAMALTLDALTVRRLSPHEHLFSLLDGLGSYHPEEGRLTALKYVPQNDFFLMGHFPGQPVFPGVLILEGLVQASRLLMAVDGLHQSGVPVARLREALVEQGEVPHGFLVESSLKHSEVVRPGDVLSLEALITRREGERYGFKVTASVGSTVVGRGRLVLRRGSPEQDTVN